jgi:hypothetical protein
VQIDVPDEDHEYRFAEIDDGVVDNLTVSLIGSASILWREEGTGLKWAIIRFGGGPDTGLTGLIPVKVWRDGGTTDGDKTEPCDRTYKVRTLDADGSDDSSSRLLGENLTPQKRRPAQGKLDTPPSGGSGVVGLGYYDSSTFILYDANETLDVEACS